MTRTRSAFRSTLTIAINYFTSSSRNTITSNRADNPQRTNTRESKAVCSPTHRSETSRLKNIYKNTVEGRHEASSVVAQLGEGIEPPIQLLNSLYRSGRNQDAKRVSFDADYRDQLLCELLPALFALCV